MTTRTVQRNLWASGLVVLILLLYWTDSTRGYFAAIDEEKTSKNCFCEVGLNRISVYSIWEIEACGYTIYKKGFTELYMSFHHSLFQFS